MKVLYITLLAFFIAIACYEDKYGQNLEFMAQNTRAFLAEQAFENHCTLSIYQFDPIYYDTVSENFIDTVELLLIQNEMINYSDQLDKLTVNISVDIKVAHEYREYGWHELTENQMKKVRKNYKLYLSLIDSLAYYVSQDSIVRKRIEDRVHPVLVYRFEAYIDAKFRNENAKEMGILNDTIVLFFNKQFEMINF